MKRLFMALAVCMLMVSGALAATYGEANLCYGPGGTISSFTAPTGQEIYCITALGEGEPYVQTEDLNFDGYDDLLVTTVVGASNAFYALYIRDDVSGQYVLVQNDTGCETDLPNVWTVPDRGLVVSQGTSGLAGLLHETYLMRWEDDRLVTWRTAVSDLRSTLVRQGRECLSYDDDGLVHGVVYEMENGERVKLWEGSVDYYDEEAVRAYLAEEEDALWGDP